MNSLLSEYEDIMEMFIGINYDVEELREAGHIELTDNLIILRGMLEQFKTKLAAGQKTPPRAQPKQKPARTKKAPTKKVAQPKAKKASADSNSE